jgi:hypothetical protein
VTRIRVRNADGDFVGKRRRARNRVQRLDDMNAREALNEVLEQLGVTGEQLGVTGEQLAEEAWKLDTYFDEKEMRTDLVLAVCFAVVGKVHAQAIVAGHSTIEEQTSGTLGLVKLFTVLMLDHLGGES